MTDSIPRQQTGEPGFDTSVIRLGDAKRLDALRAKLAEYVTAYPAEKDWKYQDAVRLGGAQAIDALHRFYGRTTLQIVLGLAGTSEQEPLDVYMSSVALRFEDTTKIDVLSAVSLPFIYDREHDWHAPRLNTPEVPDLRPYMLFARAYTNILAWSLGRPEQAHDTGLRPTAEASGINNEEPIAGAS